MSNYLTTTAASITYQTIDNCSNYLTTQSGTINQIWQSINNIRTVNLNPWVNLLKNDQSTVITATTNLYFENGLNEFYMISTLSNITIYLPVITDASQLGVRLIFRRGYGQYSQNTITFMSASPGQTLQVAYNLSNSYPATMGSNMFVISFVSLGNTLNPHWAWYQI